MKKIFIKLFLILFALGLLFSTTSCKKCLECTAREPGTNLIYYYESQCHTGSGASGKIDDFESEFRAEFSDYYVYCNIINK